MRIYSFSLSGRSAYGIRKGVIFFSSSFTDFLECDSTFQIHSEKDYIMDARKNQQKYYFLEISSKQLSFLYNFTELPVISGSCEHIYDLFNRILRLPGIERVSYYLIYLLLIFCKQKIIASGT